MEAGGWVGGGWERVDSRVGAEACSVDGDLANGSGLWIRRTKGERTLLVLHAF